jgi:hypothetical protein
MAAKGVKIGPRVTVLIGTKKSKAGKSKNLYAYMLKSVALFYGFKAVPNATVKTKKNIELAVRGATGNSIKVPMKGKKDKKGNIKKCSMSMPSTASIKEIKAFLNRAAKNKPDSFVSKFGRTHPIGEAK